MPPSPVLSAAFATATSTKWHRRLGHPGCDALMQLSRSSDIRIDVLGLMMSICVMHANWAVMFVFLFIVLLMRPAFLTLYIATYGHLMSLVFLDTSTILWWLMIIRITPGLFLYVQSLMLSPRLSTFLLGCPHSLASPSRLSSVTMVGSSITPLPVPSFSLTVSSCACLARIPPLKTVRLSA